MTIAVGALPALSGNAAGLADPHTTFYFHRSAIPTELVAPIGDAPMTASPPAQVIPAVTYANSQVEGDNPNTAWDAAWLSGDSVVLMEQRISFVWWVTSAANGPSEWRLAVWQLNGNLWQELAAADFVSFDSTDVNPVQRGYTFASVSTAGNGGRIAALIDTVGTNDAAHAILYDSIEFQSRIEIRAQNQAPTAHIGAPTTGDRVSPLLFDGTGSGDSDGTIVSYDWTFGDESTVSGASVSHQFASLGTFLVTLTVTDDEGATMAAQQEIMILNLAPLAEIDAPAAAKKKKAVTFDGSGSSDPDGSIGSWLWDFGDGEAATTPVAVHAFEVGTYTVTLTVTDNEGAASSATHTIVVSNAPPS